MAKLSSKEDPGKRGELVGSGAAVPHGRVGSRTQEQFVEDAREMARQRTVSEYDYPTVDAPSRIRFEEMARKSATETVKMDRSAILDGMSFAKTPGPVYDGFLPGWTQAGGVPVPSSSTETMKGARNVVLRTAGEYVPSRYAPLASGVREALTEEEIFAPRTDFAMYRWPKEGGQRGYLAEAGALPGGRIGFSDLLDASRPRFPGRLFGGSPHDAMEYAADRNMRRLANMKEAVGNGISDAWRAVVDSGKKTGRAVASAGHEFDLQMKAASPVTAMATKVYDNNVVKHPLKTAAGHKWATSAIGAVGIGVGIYVGDKIWDAWKESRRAVAAVSNRPGGVNSRVIETLAAQAREDPGAFLSGTNRLSATSTFLADSAEAVRNSVSAALVAYGTNLETRAEIIRSGVEAYKGLYDALRQSSPENGSEQAFDSIVDELSAKGYDYTPNAFRMSVEAWASGKGGQ